MGYTHYWDINSEVKENEKEQVINEVKKLHKNLPEYSETAGGCYNDTPIKIVGGLGDGEPVFNDKVIWFNGEDENGHETFLINFENVTSDWFCKTSRKPYDMLVCLTLISLANNIEGFSFSSDGWIEDWKPAFDFYRKHIGKTKFKINKFLKKKPYNN